MALRSLLAALALTWLASAAQAATDPRALLVQGNRLFAAGDYAAACAIFAQAQERWPRPVFLRSLAFCELKRARHREALELLRRYAAAYPRAGDTAKIAATVAELEVAMATRVSVRSNPPGAAVFFDTEASGQRGTTPFAGALAPGRHTLILLHPGCEPTSRDFVLQPRQQLTLDVTLAVAVQISSRPPGAGLHVTTVGADARAARRSPALGTTPFVGSLPLGSHQLWLLHRGHRPWQRTVTITPTGPLRLQATLPVVLRVESKPSGATLRLDGQAVAGVTPLELDATPGPHQLVLQRAGYLPTELRVRVAAHEPVTAVQVTLGGGLLTMRSQGPGGTVSLDGRPLGTTPLVERGVPLGLHTLALNRAGHRRWQGRLHFSAEEALAVELRLGRPVWPTWVGAAVAAIGLGVGLVAGALAWHHVDRVNDAARYDALGQAAGRGYCRGGGAPYLGYFKDANGALPIGGDDCGLAAQHTATAGLIGAGLAGAFAATYYAWVARPSARVLRRPRAAPATTTPAGDARDARRPRGKALGSAAPETGAAPSPR